MKISFICCVLNEVNLAPQNFLNMEKFLIRNKFDYEIILIDNGSTDGTIAWAKGLKSRKLKKIFNESNIGKGGSIKKGIATASGNICVIYDLDGEYLIDDVILGLKCFEREGSTLLLGSRTLSGEKKYIYYLNFLGVRIITGFINLIYRSDLTDAATGLKLLKTDFYKKNKIWFNGFNVDFELICLAYNKDMKVSEFLGQYNPRSKSEGKKIRAFRDGFLSILAIFVSFLRSKRNFLFNKRY